MNRSIQNNIAILLTCHNRKDKTLQCLDALYACDLPNEYCFDVYLVDDGSTDGTAEAVSVKYPKVKIIKGTGNLYWNRGMHRAWTEAVNHKAYDYYLWLNDDTYLFQNALCVLTQGDKSQIIIGTTISVSTNQITYGGFNHKHELILPIHGSFTTCQYFNGNIVLIPKSVFKKVGFNDFRFRHALGDFDYGLRAKKKKIELKIAPEVLGTCETHEKLPKWCNKDYDLVSRIIELYKPLGNNPFQHFYFDYMHYSLFNAVLHFFSIHLRTIFPTIWKHKK